jgi:Family of unknown function (DUF6049)
MVGRPSRSLAAIVAVSAISIPVALATSRAAVAEPSARSAAHLATQPQAGVAITITDMTPRQAGPSSTITVTGRLKNTTQEQLSHLAVRLLSSTSPLSDVTQIEAGQSDPSEIAGTPLPGGSWQSNGRLRPGESVGWSIRVKAKAIGMTDFGVYPLVAQVQSMQTNVTPGTAATYLPYVPAKKGTYGSSIPARTKISWVWPLIDKPLLIRPGQDICQSAQAQELAESLGSSGRLGQLVGAGANGAQTAITWAIDPALLGNVNALTNCSSSQPKLAAAARTWLDKLRQLSSAQPAFVTPYGDPDVATLIGAGHERDVAQAFRYGGSTGSRILNRAVSAGTAARRPAAQHESASIAWPAGGIPGNAGGQAGYNVLSNLASVRIQTVLLGSAYLPGEQATVLRTPIGTGGYMYMLLANDSLSRLIGRASTGQSAFTTTQEFLAETALLARQGAPIVVAPPQRWAPGKGLAADLLAVTGSASWLSPVSLTSLTSAKHIPLRRLPAEPRHRKMRRLQATILRRVDSRIEQLGVLQAKPDPDDYLAMFAAESSAWQGRTQRTAALDQLRALDQRIRRQLSQGVQIEAEQRVTLGGLKGSVPVSIDNTLGYPVAVRVVVDYNSSSGIKIAVTPGGVVDKDGLVTIPPHNVVTVRLRVQATEVGSTVVTLSLANRHRTPLLHSQTQQMTIQATQVGVLGVIIFAVALGIFLIATAARAARRGRVAPAAEQAAGPGLAGEQADDRPAGPPEPDTVMAERTELGAAGTPGRD